MKLARAARELLLALGLLAVGLIGLPAMVFLVGQRLVGEYPEGLAGLYTAIGDALVSGNGFAWVLVLSPYLCVQLVRCCIWLRPPRRTVN